MATPMYARDLAKENQTDSFMGKGFEAAMEKAEENGEDLLIGHYVENSEWRCE
jgi:hypothetical protein